ncbi:isopentenyl-diphosphate Delta-isomerase [Segetibacter sp.]|jgi:isopentenyl-diphosphate delta-isomerase|uniref:isopentenyl-diphosphate Delta-isomerase n=1 Tax=Segetibacter sp. TaxID=2231182 RepID=UPI002601D747|nr:isopentenyl-diphosphate Delta-isomerase [Segetibacter sp.]MCW3079325.1 isopentenyl-diphosphate delta-isomerase [Segetibacter sp.]
MEEVILVTEQDEQVGSMEKMEAHRKGALHRAFSVFIFNERNEMLLQQRALVKYHSGGLWTNACCSHPRPGEDVEAAALRRLHEELGFTTTLTKIFDFHYNAAFDNGLIEHEFDHVYVGIYSGKINPNPSEVKDYCYKKMDELSATIQSYPHKYTAWFCIAFPKVAEWLAGK